MDFYYDQVLSGKTVVEKITETAHVLAFHHTQPYWPLHIMVIPKRHIASLASFEPDDLPTIQESPRSMAVLPLLDEQRRLSDDEAPALLHPPWQPLAG